MRMHIHIHIHRHRHISPEITSNKTARPVKIHIDTKMVAAIFSEMHVYRVTPFMQGVSGNAMCVIQHRQIKCAGSTMNIKLETALM